MTTSKRTLFTLFIFLIIGHYSFSQNSNIILFTENGEKFFVVLNGVLQNSDAGTNVKVTGLPAPTYKLKVLFEDTRIPSIDKTLSLGKDLEMTYCIKKNKKGEYVVRFQNQIDVAQAPPPLPVQHVIAYLPVAPNNSSTVIQNQTTTTSISNVNNTGGTINININSSMESHQETEGKPHDHYIMPGYNGRVGCPYPLTDLDFENVKQSISDKPFEESKLKIAKQVTSSNCLFASEVKQIMELFSFERSKVDFAKFAYRYTYDVGNYYKVNDAFHFDASIHELEDYIEKYDRKGANDTGR